MSGEGKPQPRLWELCYQFYSRRAHAHHYLGIANGALEALTGRNIIKIKKLFYVLRPLLASKWCLERNEIAPMAMEPLMELLPEGLRPEVEELIRFKSGAAESHLICISEPLLAFIFEEKEKSGLVSSDLPKHVFSTERLNEFFKEAITVYDD
ncbi:MAG: nucleotidyltransferase domain-containing protein [Chitinophagaceae bacterium]|nr:nucleotidyltransferase domain-containing protein [Chitinophagaceae bacterium]